MLLYICTCLVLLSVVESVKVKQIETSINKPKKDAPKQADTIFADVIKNISRVNNVLQELINNYEQLQKIYKSQENVESVYSDSEIDEIFKSKNGKQPKKFKNGEEATKKPNSVRLATQMFWSDHDDDNDDSDDDEFEDVKEIKKKKKNDLLEPKLEVPVTRKTTTLKPEESSEYSRDTSLSLEKAKNLKQNVGQKAESIKYASPSKPKQQAEVIFVDTHKKPEVINSIKPKEMKVKKKIESVIQFAGISTKPKTRYSKVSHSKAINDSPAQNLRNTEINDTREVKKIMHAETFSPKKIWNDIINNKPIQLEAHNEITMRRVEMAKRNKTDNHKRSKNKTALVIITNNKKKLQQESISSEDDDLTNKEELKTSVLRQAYGDACLKLVLRKCHKACKKVLKSSCNHVKCKSSARSAFKSSAKSGCITEFHGRGGDNNKENKLYVDPTITNYRVDDRSFVDMTREGFLSAACLPDMKDHKHISLRNDTPSLTNPKQNYNILRDRFERACKKISSNKCKSACMYAYKEMCETFTCSKRMKKVFKKNCKAQCKRAYELYDSEEDSDSDDDSDDSDSDDSDADSSSVE